MKQLSDKQQDTNTDTDFIRFAYSEEDVKEFIKKLKKEMSKVNIADGYGFTYLCETIDKLAGDKLI